MRDFDDLRNDSNGDESSDDSKLRKFLERLSGNKTPNEEKKDNKDDEPEPLRVRVPYYGCPNSNRVKKLNTLKNKKAL